MYNVIIHCERCTVLSDPTSKTTPLTAYVMRIFFPAEKMSSNRTNCFAFLFFSFFWRGQGHSSLKTYFRENKSKACSLSKKKKKKKKVLPEDCVLGIKYQSFLQHLWLFNLWSFSDEVFVTIVLWEGGLQSYITHPETGDLSHYSWWNHLTKVVQLKRDLQLQINTQNKYPVIISLAFCFC